MELVECHSEYEYAEKPQAFWWQGRRLEIDEILDQWRVPGGKGFLVKTQDEQIFKLFYGELFDEWRIHQP
jgi:hypothetical protein